MRFGHIALAFLALSACGQSTDSPGADGYVFGEAEWFQTSPRVEIVEHQSSVDLRRRARAEGVRVEEGRELMAFSVIYDRGEQCEIHLVKPEVEYQPEWIGHELTHCIYGRWHP